MIQKTTWMRYLIGGVVSVFVSCTENTEYVVKADYIYINETNHTIEVLSAKTINPNKTLKITITGDGGKNITETSYVPPFESGSVIKYNSSKCYIIKPNGLGFGRGEGPAGIQNYEWKKISERYYEFTYHLTEEEYKKAGNCN